MVLFSTEVASRRELPTVKETLQIHRLDWLVYRLREAHIPINQDALAKLRLREQNISDIRTQLQGDSWLIYLPEKPPNHHNLYSLESTGGERTIVKIKDLVIGDPQIILAAGPCALENETQINESAQAARAAGATILRGGAFKPRTSPYSFQGMGETGLVIQRKVADEFGMLVVTEATSEENILTVAKYADIIQIGARNSQNFELLALVGLVANLTGKAVLYKRGPAMSINEFLDGAEYLLAAGLPADKLILCERGSKMPDGRTDLDDKGMKALRGKTHLVIIGDPTHSQQTADQVPEAAERAIKAGADGLIVEVHPNPNEALCDGKRALRPEQLMMLANNIDKQAPDGRFFRQTSAMASPIIDLIKNLSTENICV